MCYGLTLIPLSVRFQSRDTTNFTSMYGGGDIEGVDIAHGPRMEGVSVIYVDCVADPNMHHCD